MSATKDFEIIVFGATSFVGKILCDYLCNEYTEANLRWAMAARSQSKLDSLKAELGTNAQAIPTLVADSDDEAALSALCDLEEGGGGGGSAAAAEMLREIPSHAVAEAALFDFGAFFIYNSFYSITSFITFFDAPYS